MSSEIAIEFRDVTKRYSKYSGIFKLKNFLDRIKNGQFKKKLVREDDFYALKNVSFSLRKGERLGIIGPNGAGKSTTLKLINGISYPTSGNIIVNGKVGGMIELGSGFQNDLTGRENIYASAAVQGMSTKEVDQIFDRIVDISELHNFIDVPIKRYSSGMKVRLGFAVVMASAPDIVLLDEVMAVGDARFKKKSTEMVKEYLRDRTLVYVTHGLSQIVKLCDRAIVLNKGEIAFDGNPQDAVEAYKQIQEDDQWEQSETIVQRKSKRGFSEEAKIWVDTVQMLGGDGREMEKIVPGDRVRLLIKLAFEERLGLIHLKVFVRKTTLGRFSEVIGGYRLEIEPSALVEGSLDVSFETENIGAGEYILEIVPEFEKQSQKTAVVVYRRKFLLESEAGDPLLGLVDLKFKLSSELSQISV